VHACPCAAPQPYTNPNPRPGARAAVVVPVAVLALVAVALAAGCWWRRKGAGGSQPGSAKARDGEAGRGAKPGEGYLSGPGSFPGARAAGACLGMPVQRAGADSELVRTAHDRQASKPANSCTTSATCETDCAASSSCLMSAWVSSSCRWARQGSAAWAQRQTTGRILPMLSRAPAGPARCCKQAALWQLSWPPLAAAGHAGADATIAGIVEMGRAKDSASSVAGHGGGADTSCLLNGGSYTAGYGGGPLGVGEHPSPSSISGSDRPLLPGMGPLRSASYLLAARNSTGDDAQCAAHRRARSDLACRWGLQVARRARSRRRVARRPAAALADRAGGRPPCFCFLQSARGSGVTGPNLSSQGVCRI
jgi:hypothetical protein